jgi:dUTP pyrophosphatase
MGLRQPLTVAVEVLPHGAGLPLPSWKTQGAAGADLTAALADPICIEPGARALVPCGFAMALPDGWEAQVRPRSGMALRHGVTVINAPGTIDADYRGEVCVALVNLSTEAYVVHRGDRIAQLVLAPVVRATWQPVDTLPPSDRGSGGFGSTGA